MQALIYIRLVGYTAGTLLMLFWMVVILGYRRQRNFERVFFLLCLALFLFYGGSLLALNAQIYYAQPPPLLSTFAWTILSAGLCFAPALLIHLHLEYAVTRSLGVGAPGAGDRWKRLILTLLYALVVLFAIQAYRNFIYAAGHDFLLPANALGRFFGIFLAGALAGSAGWQFQFAKNASTSNEKQFHRFTGAGLVICALLAAMLHVLRLPPQPAVTAIATISLSLLPIPFFAALIYAVQRHNFLQIGRQTNLLYAVSVTFFALLYLALVRRVSGVLEPILPPEATASILLFVLVIFVEPLQRALAKRLHESAHHQMDDVRPLIAEIREKARQGDSRALRQCIAERVRKHFEFEDAQLEILGPSGAEPADGNGERRGPESFPVHQPAVIDAVLRVRPHGAMLSGEIRAALELLCEQLPAAFDLCRTIEEKLQLERELAERERMAVLGQMAASISHNLKNPLGSIKTILQVQIENPEMPESLKAETSMVLDEISRLSNKLGQLLQFSRPTLLGGGAEEFSVGEVISEICDVMRPEAERKGIQLRAATENGLMVKASREAVGDIVSNLVVNAIDAAAGSVTVSAVRVGAEVSLTVLDDGQGIPAELRAKVLQPFFTTKTQGTGLGLAIVGRRASDAGGTLELESPTADGRGTRFAVRLPLREGK